MCEEFFVKHDLDIQSISSVFTDSAPAMLGNNLGFFCLVKTGNSALARYPLFYSSTCFGIKNIASKVEKCF